MFERRIARMNDVFELLLNGILRFLFITTVMLVVDCRIGTRNVM